MAEDKKGFILYADQKELFNQLPNEKAGELIKHIFSYVNDENPITEDLIINLAFTPIKQQLKRDLVKYEDKLEKKSISGREGNLKRWYPCVYKLYKETELTLKDAEIMANDRKVSHTDKVLSQSIANIAVNDTVIVNDTDKDINTNNTPPAKAVVKIDFDKLLLFINKTTGRSFKTINTKTKNSFKARLKEGYTNSDIQTAIQNSVKDKFHIENNFKWLKPEYYSRSNTLDMHSNINKAPVQGLSMAEQVAHIKTKVGTI